MRARIAGSLSKRTEKGPGAPTIIEEDVGIWLLDWTMMYIFPLGRFQPYLRAGIGFMQGDFDGTNVSRHLGAEATFGGGADVYVTRHLAVNFDVDYIVPISDAVEDLQFALFTVGLKYRF